MKISKPKRLFKPKKKERLEYKTVSYRLPAKLLDDLNKYVDSENSACSLVSQMMEWALNDMKEPKRGKL